jgi:uncharacterized protein YjbJ (UPF0337 family)
MGSPNDRVKGVANEITGTIKLGSGQVAGNQNLAVEGAVQKPIGRRSAGLGTAKDAIKKVIYET